MKKFIFAPIVALMAVLAYMAPATAGTYSHGPECNAFGTQCTNVSVHFDYTNPDANNDVTVTRVRIWAGNPAGLKGTNGMTINHIEVDGPAGAYKWGRNDVQVDKSGPGSLEVVFTPSFKTDHWSTFDGTITLHWQDGTNDQFHVGGSI